MFIVKFLTDYQHTETTGWKAGEMPTISRRLAKKVVNELHVAEWVGEGCGCPGADAAVIARTLETRGVTQEEMDAFIEEQKAEKDALESQPPAAKPPTKKSK